MRFFSASRAKWNVAIGSSVVSLIRADTIYVSAHPLPPRPLPHLACSQSDDSEAVASSSTGNVVTGPASAPRLAGPPWAYPRPGLSKLDEGPPFSSVILLYLGLPTLGGGCPLLDHFLLEVRCQEHSQVSLPYTMAPRAKLSKGVANRHHLPLMSDISG